jgi:hypothetical protein
MAKSMNIKNGGSTKPLVRVRKEKPMTTVYRESALPGAGDKNKTPFNVLTNNVAVGDSHRIQKAVGLPGRIKGGNRPGFLK